MSGGYEKVKYEQRVVAFIDILGFSSLVRDADKNPSLIEKIYFALELGKDPSRGLPTETKGKIDYKQHAFSDSIVISSKPSEEGFWHMLGSAAALSLSLSMEGIYTRGGIRIGNLFHSQDMVFGPALVDAYNLETSVADVPRIVYGNECLKFAQKTARWKDPIFKNFFRRGPDGVWHIPGHKTLMDYNIKNKSYLSAAESAIAKTMQRAGRDFFLGMEESGFQIFEKLSASLDEMTENPRAFKKLKWLAEQWDLNVGGSKLHHGRRSLPRFKP